MNVSFYLRPFDALRDPTTPLVVPDGVTAQVLGQALGMRERAAGHAAWRMPAVLGWSAAVMARHEEERLAGARVAPFLLSAEQEQALWQQVLAADGGDLRAPEQAAPSVQAAWRLARLWRTGEPRAANHASADQAAFARWAAAFRARTSALGAIDVASALAEQAAVAPGHGHGHGFVAPAPALADWLGAPTGGTVVPPAAPAQFDAHAFTDREQELVAAFSWAAGMCAGHPRARVVIALDDLRRDGETVQRAARDVLGSSDACVIATATPLARLPVFRALLGVLELAPVTRWDRLAACLCHGALDGAAEERAARARLDARLRQRERYELPLAEVLAEIADDPALARLRAILEGLLARHAAAPRRQSMVGWLQHFDACLASAGWPGVAPTDVLAASARRAWNEVCDRLYRLDAVLPVSTRAEALQRLRQVLQETAAPAPAPRLDLFVVTPAQALALAPDYLWLAGCESGLLVAGQRHSPYLPLAAQRAAGVPGADPGRDLARARALLARLAGSGVEHHASYAAGDGDERYAPSPLVAGLHTVAHAPRVAMVPAGWHQPPARLESFDDDWRGTALAPGAVLRGGTAALDAQSACPFRAFARHRLAAGEVAEPRPGLSARAKGTLVHRCLAEAWGLLGDSAALAALDLEGRHALVQRAVRQALRPQRHQTALERAVLEVEQDRLGDLLERWLLFEMTREGAFSVVARERGEEVEFGGLRLGVRLDRIDRRADGSRVVVDYKTGRCSVKDWAVPRMAAPQLPFYALLAPGGAIAAVAYAAVDRERPQWLQLPAAPPPSVQQAAADASSADADADWQAQLTAWQRDLANLAAEIGSGLAAPTPREGAATCRQCEQAPLCRLVERDNGVIEDGDDDASGERTGRRDD